MPSFRSFLSRSARFSHELAELVSTGAVIHDLTLTCDLMFLRFADRIISVDTVDGTMQDRLIERIEPDRYAVIDRYETSGDTPGRIDHYTVTLFDAQYLGPHSFDRDGLRLTFAPRGDGRLHAQRLTRRADRLGDELRAEPSLNLQRGCRCIEYAAADVPDPAELTQMLELAEPVSLDPIR